MTVTKQTKMFFLTDEALRLVQIVAIIMAVGVFVDTTRTTKAISASQSEAIDDLQIRQARAEDNALRTAEILTMMEARLKNHEVEDAATSETVKRNTEIINSMIMNGKVR
jgi:hypothetical protein